MYLILCLYGLHFQVHNNLDVKERNVFLSIYGLHSLSYYQNQMNTSQFHRKHFFLRDFSSIILTSETALTLVFWCPGRNCIWVLRSNLRLDNGRVFHSVECLPFAHAAELFQNKDGTDVNKYYLSSNEWSFSIFKGKYVISEERMEMNLWERCEKKDLPALDVFCFSTNFMPIDWMSQRPSHRVPKEHLGKQIHLPDLCFILALQEGQAGSVWCLVMSQVLVSHGVKRNGWKQQRKGKQRYWWVLGGQKMFRALLGVLREYVHTGDCVGSYSTSR